MSAPAFTPGPWEARGDNDRYEADTVPVYAGRHQVCDVYGFETSQRPDMTVAEAEANARLIAAAPDGYEVAGAFIMAAINEWDIPENADEGWILDSLGHGVGGAYLDAIAYRAKARGEQ
jgi:hypothetical protein